MMKNYSRALLSLYTLFFLYSPLAISGIYESGSSKDPNEGLVKQFSDFLPGEKIDLHSGEVGHYLEMVSFEGNGLPIKLGHRFRADYDGYDKDITSIELEVPRIEFTHLGRPNYLRLQSGGESSDYWVKSSEYSTNINCSNLNLPPAAAYTYYDNTMGINEPNAFLLSGIKINLGYESIDFYPNNLNATPRFPSNAVYVSPSNWYITCVSSLNVTGNNAFKATSPDGTEYIFDIYQEKYNEDGLVHSTDARIYVSSIKDTWGNQLNYSYDRYDVPCRAFRCYSPSMYYRSRIEKISASDGRELNITYAGSIVTVESNSTKKPIKLVYQEISKKQLKITRADTKYWLYNFDTDWRLGYTNGTYLYITDITYPNGLKVVYNQQPRRVTKYRVYPKQMDFNLSTSLMALQKRTVSGPGLSALVEDYTYIDNDSAGENTTIVRSPIKTVLYKYKQVYSTAMTQTIPINSGKLLQKNVYSPDATASNYSSKIPLKQTNYSYSRQANVMPASYISDHFYLFQKTALTSNPAILTHLRGAYQTQVSKIVTQINGHTFTIDKSDYDEWGNAQTITESSTLGKSRTITRTFYNDKPSWIIGKLATESVSGESAITEVVYDPTHGSITDKTVHGIKQSYTYHTDGNLHQVKDGNGVVFKTYNDYYRGIARNEYDGVNNHKRTEVYDYGKVKSETDFNGNPATLYEYDAVHRLSKITPPKGAATTITWPTETQKVVARVGYKQTTDYNALMQPTLVTEEDTSRQEARYTRIEYDAAGRAVFKSVPSYDSTETLGTTFAYDALNRLTSKTEPGESSSTTICYGANCNTTRAGKPTVQHGQVVTDTRGYETVRNYQSFGDPEDKDLIEIQQQKDSSAYIATVIDRGNYGQIKNIKQNNLNRHFTYELGTLQVDTKTEPEVGITTYDYDVRGNLSSKQVGNKGTTYYHYYNNDLIEHIDYPGTTGDVSYTYQGHNLDTLTTGNKETLWDYDFDAVNQIEKEALSIDGLTFTTEYVYDTLGNLDHYSLPNISQPQNARRVEVTEDALSRTRSIYDSSSDYVTDIDYYANDVISDMLYSNGYRYHATLNDKKIPENISTTDLIVNLVDLTYGYDSEENITSITDAAQSGNNRGMGYDGLGRLTTANGRWGNGVISYDNDHDIQSMTLGSQTLSYHYNAGNNRLDSVSGGLSKTFSYDNYGNVIGNGSDSFIYDDANQMLSVTNQNIDYKYDGNKKRVKVHTPDKTVYYVYNLAGELLYRYDATQNKDVEYINLNGKLVAKLEQGPNVVPTIVPDSDGDGLNDRDELIWGTKVNNPDSDGDGIKDGDEIAFWGTSPTKWDTDGDGLNDFFEVNMGLSPTDTDTDNNGIWDAYEDSDGDGLTNLQEMNLKTDPSKVDTDGDGVSDADEVALGTDPNLNIAALMVIVNSIILN